MTGINMSEFTNHSFKDWADAIMPLIHESNDGNMMGDNIPSCFTPEAHMLFNALAAELTKFTDEMEALDEALKQTIIKHAPNNGMLLVIFFWHMMSFYGDAVDHARKVYMKETGGNGQHSKN